MVYTTNAEQKGLEVKESESEKESVGEEGEEVKKNEGEREQVEKAEGGRGR